MCEHDQKNAMAILHKHIVPTWVCGVMAEGDDGLISHFDKSALFKE